MVNDNYIILFKKKSVAFQQQTPNIVHNIPVEYYDETCALCRDSKMHKCIQCAKPVCNFCTLPACEDNEMQRKHKSNDLRCNKNRTTTSLKTVNKNGVNECLIDTLTNFL